MPNSKHGSGQTHKDTDRMSQGQRGGYGNTTQEAGGSSQQNKEMNQGQHGEMGSQSGGRGTGGQGGNDDEM